MNIDSFFIIISQTAGCYSTIKTTTQLLLLFIAVDSSAFTRLRLCKHDETGPKIWKLLSAAPLFTGGRHSGVAPHVCFGRVSTHPQRGVVSLAGTEPVTFRLNV